MFNLPVKLSVLSTPYFSLSPQVFLDRSPGAALAIYLEILPQKARETLDFAYSPQALLLMLEHEFEVRVAKREIVFLKSTLDAESWLMANGLTECLRVPKASVDLLESVTEQLWAHTALCDAGVDALESRLALRRELKTLLSLYLVRYGHQPQAVQMLNTATGKKRLFSLVVAEAMYKADGARVLFGSTAPYTRLWEAKQHQFYHYATVMAENVLKLPA